MVLHKLVAVVLFGLSCHIIAEGRPPPVRMLDDTLVRWPEDFNGVAVVPSHVRHVGFAAFAQCKSLTGVVLPRSIETIGQSAFMGCERLRDMRIPSSVTNIGGAAFANCLTLTSVVVRARIEKIPGSMCSGCYGLKYVELPYGVSEVDDGAFCGCRSIVDMCIPESVKRIGHSAFSGCCRIRKMVLPKRMKRIDNFAFYGCYDLRYLVAGPELKKVGANAFRDCPNLRGFVVEGMSSAVNDGILTEGAGNCTVFVVGGGKNVPVKNDGAGRRLNCTFKVSKTIEDAIAICDEERTCEQENEMFRGLELTLRIAADGLVAGLPENNARIGGLDTLVARLPELKSMEGKESIKRFFIGHSQFFGDSGDKMTVDIDVLNDIRIMLEFKGDLLAKLTMSEGLKKAIRKGLEVETEMNGVGTLDDVLRWLK